MGTKITALPQVVNTVGTDELPISQDDGSGGRITYKATLDQVKNYVKNSGGGSGSVTSVGVNSTDGSISVFGSPIVGAGTITVNVSSVGLAKLDDGGAIGGQVLTYNGSTSTWVASAAPSSGIITNNVDNTPIGSVSWFAASSIPTGYLECNGDIVSKSQYSELWTTIGDTFSAVALSANHFRLPDLRGEFIRGWDHGKGVDNDRVFGSNQKGSLIAFDSTKVTTSVVGVTNAEAASEGVTPESSAKFEFGYDQITPSQYNSGLVRFAATDGSSDTITNVPNNFGATRPRNVALLPCIKALKTVTGSTTTLNFIEKPASVSNGQVLTYNGSTSTWVASAAPDSTITGSIVAWVNFNGNRNTTGVLDVSGTVTNTSRLIRASNNVSSVVRNAKGEYRINFTNPISDNNYIITGNGSYGSEMGGAAGAVLLPDCDSTLYYVPHTNTYCVTLFNAAGAGNVDVQNAYISIIR